jgi:hypothetical protein
MLAADPHAATRANPGTKSGNRRASGTERVFAGVVSSACAGPLLLGATLTPDPAGHGTHVQLGLPPCGWVQAFGKPCPTCGMTTAFTHMAHGRPDQALLAQPAGATLALLAVVVFWIGLHTAVTGSRAFPAALAAVRARHAVLLVVVIAAGWLVTFLRFPGA